VTREKKLAIILGLQMRLSQLWYLCAFVTLGAFFLRVQLNGTIALIMIAGFVAFNTAFYILERIRRQI
jgi:hypothetical protein